MPGRARTAVWLILICLAALYARAEGLDRDSLWHDEAHSALIARRPPADLIRASALEDNNPPLYYLVLHGWTAAAGGSDETAVRTPSVAFGVAGIVMTFLIARRWGGIQVGLWSAALIAASVFHVQHSREARMYSLVFLLSTASMHAFARLEEGRWPRAAAWVVTSTALLLSHTAALFALVAQHLCWLLVRLNAGRASQPLTPAFPRWLGMNAVVGLVMAPWGFVMIQQYRRLSDMFWIPRPYLTAPLDILIALTGSIPLMAAVSAAAVIGAIRLARPAAVPERGARWPPRLVLGVLFLWGAVPIVAPWLWSYVAAPILIPRIAIATLAPLAIMAAFGVSALRPRGLSAAAGILLVAISGVHAWAYTQRLTKEDWRGTAAYLQPLLQRGDVVLFHEASRRKGFDYYLPRPNADVAGFPARRFRAGETIGPRDLDELNALVRPYSRVWLVLANSHDPEHLIEATLARAFVLTEARDLRQVKVRLFTRRRDASLVRFRAHDGAAGPGAESEQS